MPLEDPVNRHLREIGLASDVCLKQPFSMVATNFYAVPLRCAPLLGGPCSQNSLSYRAVPNFAFVRCRSVCNLIEATVRIMSFIKVSRQN